MTKVINYVGTICIACDSDHMLDHLLASDEEWDAQFCSECRGGARNAFILELENGQAVVFRGYNGKPTTYRSIESACDQEHLAEDEVIPFYEDLGHCLASWRLDNGWSPAYAMALHRCTL